MASVPRKSLPNPETPETITITIIQHHQHHHSCTATALAHALRILFPKRGSSFVAKLQVQSSGGQAFVSPSSRTGHAASSLRICSRFQFGVQAIASPDGLTSDERRVTDRCKVRCKYKVRSIGPRDTGRINNTTYATMQATRCRSLLHAATGEWEFVQFRWWVRMEKG